MTDQHMFTIAESPHDSTLATFLFHRPNCKDDDVNPILHAMQKHPVLSGTCCLGVIIPNHATANAFEISTDLEMFLVPDTYADKHCAMVHIGGPHGDFQHINMYQCVEDCKLPHKTLLNCASCLETDTVQECPAKRLLRKFDQMRYKTSGKDLVNSHDPDELRLQLKNRKDFLDTSMFISPILTAIEPFSKTIRSPDEHDFDQVEYWSKVRSSASKETTRRKKFTKTVCPTCLVQNSCAHTAEWRQKICHGPYDLSEEQASTQIVKNHIIPYTDELLVSTLMHRMGSLPFRIDRKLSHLSCRVVPDVYLRREFRFGIVHDYIGDFYRLEPNDLHDILQRLDKLKPITAERHTIPLSTHEKAILLELATRAHSPPENHYWHRTRYKSFYIEMEWGVKQPREFVLNYRWTKNRTAHFIRMHPVSRKAEYEYQNRGWLFPYPLAAHNLRIIYENYGDLCTLQKTAHPLRRGIDWDLH